MKNILTQIEGMRKFSKGEFRKLGQQSLRQTSEGGTWPGPGKALDGPLKKDLPLPLLSFPLKHSGTGDVITSVKGFHGACLCMIKLINSDINILEENDEILYTETAGSLTVGKPRCKIRHAP